METHYQPRTPIRAKLNQVQKELASQEVKEMLENGVIRETIHCKDQFGSHLFLVSKKDGGQQPVINLKDLKTFIPYKHFKGLHLLKEILEQDDYLCKLDLKDAYFYVPLNKQSRKYVRFEWEGSLYESICLYSGLGPSPKLLTKLIKRPVSILRKLYLRIIVYLDDFLILGKTLEEKILRRDTVIYLLQNLGFVKLKEISSSPNTENRILGDDNRLGEDVSDSVSASREGRIDFQKVSGYIVNGLFQKKAKQGWLRIYFFEKPQGIFKFFNLPLEIWTNQSFTTRISTKFCYTPRKF